MNKIFLFHLQGMSSLCTNFHLVIDFVDFSVGIILIPIVVVPDGHAEMSSFAQIKLLRTATKKKKKTMRTGQEVAQWLRWLRLDWPSPCVTSQRRTQHDVRTSWLYAIMPNQSTHTPLQFIFSPFTRRQPSQNWCDFPVYFGSLMQNVFECQHPTIPPSQHQSISLITAWRSPQKKLELSTNIRFMSGVESQST